MKFEFSAGGVVIKKNDGKHFILVAQHSQHHGWGFPKGLIGDKQKGESEEETAVREVKEETGVTAEILQPLSPSEYWYQFKGEKRKKTVYYFLMKYLSGSFEDRDFEMKKVEWLPEEEVLARLTFPTDKKVWEEAQKLLNKLLVEG